MPARLPATHRSDGVLLWAAFPWGEAGPPSAGELLICTHLRVSQLEPCVCPENTFCLFCALAAHQGLTRWQGGSHRRHRPLTSRPPSDHTLLRRREGCGTPAPLSFPDTPPAPEQLLRRSASLTPRTVSVLSHVRPCWVTSFPLTQAVLMHGLKKCTASSYITPSGGSGGKTQRP